MYRGRLLKDLDLWVAKGLIERRQADSMVAEFDARGSSFSIGAVLMILAAVLLSASILLMIAAGWQDIPRLVKIVGIFALIWIFHGIAAVAAATAAPRLSAAALVLGSASFGGAIALVGQQYHLSGDGVDAMLLWFVMTSVSAAVFRSGALTFACGLLSWVVFGTFIDQHGGNWNDFYAVAIVGCGVVIGVLVLWTGATRAAHFAYLLALALIFWVYTLSGDTITAVGLAFLGLLVFTAATVRNLPWSAMAQRAGAALPVYAFALALMGIALLHLDIDADGPVAMALLAVITIAGCILALVLAGRDNGAVRFLAYAAFAIEVLYLSFVTIDSMLGTSGFFLLSGFVVAILAFVVIRLEKLFAGRAAKEAA